MRTIGKTGRLGQPRKVGGFTYLAMLATIAIMGITLAAASEVWHIALKREKERELLFVGDQFRRAINSYHAHTPVTGRFQVERLEDLLRDPRYPATQRYLRKIYVDPLSGSADWGLVKGPNGEILGIHSLSGDEPVKKGNFSTENREFEGKTSYADWVFMQSTGTQPAGQHSARPSHSPDAAAGMAPTNRR